MGSSTFIHRYRLSDALFTLITPSQAIVLRLQNLMQKLQTNDQTKAIEKGRRGGKKMVNFCGKLQSISALNQHELTWKEK